MTKEIKLPPLPDPAWPGAYSAPQMESYATQAVEADRAGLIEKWENYHANEAEGEAFTVGYFTRTEEEDAYKAQQQGEPETGLLGEIIGCFDAAIAEGLFEAIDTTTDERLKDLLQRRVMHAYFAAIGPSAPQPPAQQQQGEAVAWQKGYTQGVEDERISEANTGIAGFDAKVNPARTNPYTHPAPAQPLMDEQIDALMSKECLPKNMRYAFSAGIRSAEAAHNIGA